MDRPVIAVFCILAISFVGSESATIECDFKTNSWSVLLTVYTCRVTKEIAINLMDTVYINSTTGSHLSGHTNDNVIYFYTSSITVSYFPRGLDAIFKNLKGIRFDRAGMKEIHQSDLKQFPKLVEFLIYTGSQIEILEEGLFDFNPHLEYINLHSNKITHIDPKAFDSLTKLRYLYLNVNTCTSKSAEQRSAVPSLIQEIKPICNNSDYSTLDQKLKFLVSESKSLDFNDFKEELENFERKVNASNFVNYFQPKLQNLKILDEKSPNSVASLKSMISQVCNASQQSSNEASMYRSINESLVNLNSNVGKIDEKLGSLGENMLNVSHRVVNIEDQMSSLNDNFSTFNKEASTELKDKVAENNEKYAELSEKLANVKDAIKEVNTILKEHVELQPKATDDVTIAGINEAAEKSRKELSRKNGREFRGNQQESPGKRKEVQ